MSVWLSEAAAELADELRIDWRERLVDENAVPHLARQAEAWREASRLPGHEAAPPLVVYRVVKASLESGLLPHAVASGVMHGLLVSPFGCSSRVVRSAAASVMAACLCYGSAVRPTIDGILQATARHAEEQRADPAGALAEASAGIIAAVDGEEAEHG